MVFCGRKTPRPPLPIPRSAIQNPEKASTLLLADLNLANFPSPNHVPPTHHPRNSSVARQETRDQTCHGSQNQQITLARSLAEADDDDGTLYRVCVWFRWYSPATNDIIIFYLKPSRIHFPFGPRHAMPRHVCLGEGESARITNRNKSAVQISGSWFRFFFPSSH